MRKRNYRAVPVKHVDAMRLLEGAGTGRVVFGIDVAKVDFYGAFYTEGREPLLTVKWQGPKEHDLVVRLLGSLGTERVDVAMESSGTYGDALWHQVTAAGFPVYRVSPKRTHDSAEAHHGVPSMHDAKASAIIALLHLDGASRLWEGRSDEERGLAAAEEIAVIHDEQARSNSNRLEAKLARHWPELTAHLKLGSATLNALLEQYGSPQHVAADAEGAREVMTRVGRAMLAPEVVETVIQSARSTRGVPMIEAERQAMKMLVGEIVRNQAACEEAKARIAKLVEKDQATTAVAQVIGTMTAAVLTVEFGQLGKYESPAALVKAAGLNLKEVSSGKHHGALKLTKRGSSKARRYLYLGVLRLIQSDPVMRAWHLKKVKRDGGGVKLKSVGALMRKLLSGLWHVARGAAFDSSKLFDTSKLSLAA